LNGATKPATIRDAIIPVGHRKRQAQVGVGGAAAECVADDETDTNKDQHPDQVRGAKIDAGANPCRSADWTILDIDRAGFDRQARLALIVADQNTASGPVRSSNPMPSKATKSAQRARGSAAGTAGSISGVYVIDDKKSHAYGHPQRARNVLPDMMQVRMPSPPS
jgi:hypothetical protein